MEPVTTEVYGVRVLACLPKLILHAYTSNILKLSHKKYVTSDLFKVDYNSQFNIIYLFQKSNRNTTL